MTRQDLEMEFVRQAAAAQAGIKRQFLDYAGCVGLVDEALARMRERLIGQDAALERLGNTLSSRAAERFVGWDEAVRSLRPTWDRRPWASLLAVGPTGVGKTETAKILAERLFGGRHVVLNCSEVGSEAAHGTSMWTGSPPGYVGSERGGVLTDALRAHRTGVILIDELEKASPEAVQNILIPLLGEGTVTDKNNGETLWATDCIVFCTSNVKIDPTRIRAWGFAKPDDGRRLDDSALLPILEGHLLKEVIGRFNAFLCYAALDLEAQWKVWSCLRHELAAKIGPGTQIALDETARRFVQDRFAAMETGARGVRDLFRDQIVPLVVGARAGDVVSITVRPDGEGLAVSGAKLAVEEGRQEATTK